MGEEFSATDTFPYGQAIVWQPNPAWMAESNLRQLMDRHHIRDYDELQRRAGHDLRWFWNAVLADLDIQFYQPYTQIVDLSEGLPFPRWCVDGQLNIIHNCLDKWVTPNHPMRDQVALRWEGEEGTTVTFTYAELDREVCRCANALRALGLGKGDVVALYMPMIPELAIAFLAIVKIGGILLPLFSGYGPSAIINRLNDAQAKAVITSDGVLRRGKPVPMKTTLDEALSAAGSVQHVIVVNRAHLAELPWAAGRDYWWHELVPQQSPTSATEQTSAEDVLMLIYTSGTTGKPKGAVHTHCGFPIKAAQDMRQAMDLKPQDTLYWLTDMGWMMGPWEVFGVLLNGATMVFYDGGPDYPDVDRLWALVEKHQISHLGVSPTLIRSLKTHGTAPIEKHDISSLRMICSTGSPWDPETWLWLFHTALRGEKPIINYSGGTECSGGIICSNLFKPIKPCSFAGPMLGMDVDVVDEQGRSVRNSVGELVIRQPWIGMTRGFWHDRQRYLDTYWQRFPNVWVHGDFATIDEDGLWYILGRSDDTIKVAGKRLGPAEVEAILNAHPAVIESAAIGVPHPIKDQEVVAFCVLRNNYAADEALRLTLLDLVTQELGKPLKPRAIKFTTALPKTRNAKIMHRLIRAAYLDQPMGDLSSLETPSAVDAIRAAI
ncbi:MAG: AMP-binding protein [Chloroflexi bacterium]|nr:AMP-binding protein [Chloroflexota bacterium]